MRYRYSRQFTKVGSEYRLIGANLALRKVSLKKTGLFDERFPQKNDETDLLRRVRLKRFKIRYNQNLSILRNQRKSLWLVALQFFQYGKGRMKQIRYSGKPEDLVFIIPMAFLFYLLFLPLYKFYWAFIPLGLYLILAIATASKAALKHHKPSLLVTMPLIFPIIHLSYAFGLLRELLWESKDLRTNVKVRIRRIKSFSSEQ
jgi:GT2 family glycosyltransferase